MLLKRAIIVIMISSFLWGSRANCQTGYDIASLLQDASYILNRYDELIGMANFDGWTLPQSEKSGLKQGHLVSHGQVEPERVALATLLKKQQWTAVELLDVYQSLVTASSDLQSLAWEINEWGGAAGLRTAPEYASAGGKAKVTAAKLYVMLRKQIADQEAGLATCKSAKSPK